MSVHTNWTLLLETGIQRYVLFFCPFVSFTKGDVLFICNTCCSVHHIYLCRLVNTFFFLNKVPQNWHFVWKYYAAACKEVSVPKYMNNCFKFCMDLVVCILKVKLLTDFFYSCTLFFVVLCFLIHSKMLTVIAVAYIWCFEDQFSVAKAFSSFCPFHPPPTLLGM